MFYFKALSKKLVISSSAACILVLSASALELSVSGFYSPGMAFGPAAEVNELKPLGFSGDFNLRLNRNLELSLGGGYAVYKYHESPHVIPAIGGYAFFEEIPIVVINVGAGYGFPLSKFTPYLAGGATLALEFARYGYKTDIDVAPGIYVGAGIRYSLLDDLVFEVGPRYQLLFDDPVIVYNAIYLVRAEEHSQLLNLRVGLSYVF